MDRAARRHFDPLDDARADRNLDRDRGVEVAVAVEGAAEVGH
ncbi:MAG TPA: hypothetical protein VF406_04575 [Thermodesulfobacteriota bacterium]